MPLTDDKLPMPRPLRAARPSLGCLRFALAVCLAASVCSADAYADGEAIPAQVQAVHRIVDLGSNVESFCITLVENAEYTLSTPGHPLAEKLTKPQRARWIAAIRAACEPERATRRHLAHFAGGYDAEAARAVTDWYASETGHRLLAFERAAGDTDWDAEVMPFVDAIVQEPVPVERVKLFERIDAATRSTADAAELQTSITEILTYAAEALLPVDERRSPEAIDAHLAALRAQFASQLAGQQSVVFMFVYRDARDADLAAFADFSESAGARWLHATHRMAMLQLVAELRAEIEATLGAS